MSEARTATEASLGYFERNDFVLRRLHSLLGLVPLTLFMLEHMFTNMKATQGPEAFHGAVDFLTGLPGLYLIEFAFILLPLYFHGLFGVYVWATGKSNLSSYGRYSANWRYSLQRWSGVAVLVFVSYHLLHWRFGVRFPWNADGWSVAHYSTETLLSSGLPNPDSFFYAMRAEFQTPLMFGIYVLGLLVTMYHLANGLWTFAITWGITRSRAAQRRWGYVCAGLGVVLFLAGVLSLVGFVVDGGIGWIQPVKQAALGIVG